MVKCANHVACNAMTYGAGKFVSVHIESGAYSTDNGETWTDVPITGGSYNWLGITYANGLFVAGGQDGYITTSIDGVTWSQPVQVIPKGTGATNDNAEYIHCKDELGECCNKYIICYYSSPIISKNIKTK